MNSGYVYIFINPSIPNMIKIGKTKRDTRIRAKELSNTSVPTEFIVAFEIFSDDMDNLENSIHEKLHDFRVANNREFFRYPLVDAIKLLQKLNIPPIDMDSEFAAISIYKELEDKYPSYLKEDISDVRIIQSCNRVWLEITSEELIAEYLKDIIIKRSDLGFIVEDINTDGLFFNPSDNIYINSQKFINDFNLYNIFQTTDLFSEKAWNDFNKEREL